MKWGSLCLIYLWGYTPVSIKFWDFRTQRRWCLAQWLLWASPAQLWSGHLCSCIVTPGTRIQVTKGVSQPCWHLVVHQNITSSLDAFLPWHRALSAKCYSSCHQLTVKRPESAIFQKLQQQDMTRKNLVLLVPWAFTYMEDGLKGRKKIFRCKSLLFLKTLLRSLFMKWNNIRFRI